MVALLIQNDFMQVYVKANQFETTDFAYILTFSETNPNGNMLLHELKGNSFQVLNHANGNVIISLPLEGWGCTKISEEEFLKTKIGKIEYYAEKIKDILAYDKMSTNGSRYLMASYENERGIIVANLIICIKCTQVKSGIAANITICGDENEYFVMQGMKVERIFKKYLSLDELYIGLAKLFINKYLTKSIQSIDEIISTNFAEF